MISKPVLTTAMVLLLTACGTADTGTTSNGTTGCEVFEECTDSSDSSVHEKSFKTSYEALNGTLTASGKTNITVTIPETNPFRETDLETVLSRIDNKETFYLYVGDPMCPWCRAVIETACKKAEEYGITEIAYIDIWDEEGNELFRDRYELTDNGAVLVSEGTEEYRRLLEYLGPVLSDYELSDGKTSIVLEEKRIYSPNFIRIENGTAVKMTEGIPKQLSDPREKLTEQQQEEMAAAFDAFFSN